MKRTEIDNKYKWDLTLIFKNDIELNKTIKSVEDNIKKIKQFENQLNNKKKLLEFLNFDSVLNLNISKLYTYTFLQKATDITDAKWNKYCDSILNLYTTYSVATSFASTEICNLDTDFLIELSKDKAFENFSRILENAIKQKPHILSKKEERLLSGMSNFADFKSVYTALNDSEIKFGKIMVDGKREEVTHSKYQVLLRNKLQSVRNKTYDLMHKSYGKFNLTLAQNYINRLKYEKFLSEQRNFESPFHLACFEEEVDTQIFHSLINVVEKNLPAFQQYLKLKQQKLNIQKFFISDIYVNTTSCPEKVYEYDQMVKLVLAALSPLGEEYCNNIKEAVKKRLVDVFPNDNKESGAFETSCGIGVPYVMLNFEKNYNGVTTFAHEFGHAMHSFYTEKEQPLEKQNYEIFVAEVASTVNEMLVSHYMIDHASSHEERNYYVEDLLTEYTSAVFYQSLYGEFEFKLSSNINKGKPVTYDEINKTFSKLLNKYFGKNVKKSKYSKYGWSRIPHFYRPFYVYKYATSMLISVLISEKILKEGKPFVEKYIKFLKSGSSKSPVELLKICGIDADIEATYELAFEHYKKLIKLYEN